MTENCENNKAVKFRNLQLTFFSSNCLTKKIEISQLTAVTWKESMQATESSVLVGPAVVNDSKSSLREHTSTERIKDN